MLALAAARLGFDVAVLDPGADARRARVAARTDHRPPTTTQAAWRAWPRSADVITFEFENVPAGVVERLSALGAEVAPGPRALAVAQDRVAEKTFLNGCGAPTVAFAPIDAAADIAAALERLGAPALLKTRREGYDGKGQTWVESARRRRGRLRRASAAGPAIVEAPADFVRELSVIAARGRDGEIAAYPLGENHHESGILRRTTRAGRPSPSPDRRRPSASPRAC